MIFNKSVFLLVVIVVMQSLFLLKVLVLELKIRTRQIRVDVTRLYYVRMIIIGIR